MAVGHVQHRAGAEAGPVGVPGGKALKRHVFAVDEFEHTGIARHGDDLGSGTLGADGKILHVFDLQLPAVVVNIVPAIVLAAVYAVALCAGEIIAAAGEGNDGVRRDGL